MKGEQTLRERARILTGISLATFAWAPIVWTVRRGTAARIHDPEQAPPSDQLVVLGAPVRRGLTPVLEDRLRTALGLHAAGVARSMLLTGTPEEVSVMRAFAVEQGVPESALELDPQGHHTFESVARLPRDRRLLLVSQRFHLPRSLFLANAFGLDAHGVVADRRSYRELRRYQSREVVSSVLAFWMARGGGR